MNLKEAKEIMKKNWPDARYTMIIEALEFLIKEAETLDKIKAEVDEFHEEIIDLSDLGERVSNIL